jgi:3-isopropylmalate/(R)-2-methylmalate dehydratase large subunit
VALSTGTLNIPGRMGSDNAEIYSASPYTIAASAITSVITDPRTIL